MQKKKGYESYILYLIQRDHCKSFKIANDIDKDYDNALSEALKAGVKILCYDCEINNKEIKIQKQISFDL